MVNKYLKQGARNTITYAIGSGIVRLINFFLLPIFLGALTLSQFGIWDFYQNLLTTGTVLLSSCASIGLSRFYFLHSDDQQKQKEVIGNSLALTFLGSLLGMCVALFIFMYYRTSGRGWYAFLTCMSMNCSILFTLLITLAKTRERLFSYLLLFCGQSFLFVGGMVWGVMEGFGIDSFFYASICSCILFIPYFLRKCWHYRFYSLALMRQQLAYALPILVYIFLFSVLMFMDRALIKSYVGYEALGAYSLLWRFGSIFQFVSIALMDAWILTMFSAQKESNGNQLIGKLTTYLCITLTTLGLGSLGASHMVIYWLFPEKYLFLRQYLPCFFAYMAAMEIVKIFHASFSLSNKTIYLPFLTAIIIGLQTLLLYGGIHWGIWGVLGANVITFITYAGFCYVVGTRLYSTEIFNVPRKIRVLTLFSIYLLSYQLLQPFHWVVSVILLATWPLALWLWSLTDDEKETIRSFVFKSSPGDLSGVPLIPANGSDSGYQPTILYVRTEICKEEFTAGGEVAHIIGVISEFKKKNYRLYCFTSYCFSRTLSELKFDHFKKLYEVPVFFFMRWKLGHLGWRLNCFASNIFFTAQIMWGVQDQKIDYVYQRYHLLNMVGVLLSKIKKVPLIIEYHGSEVWIFSNWGRRRFLRLTWLSKWVERVNLRHAHCIVTISQVLKNELIARGVDEHKILVNPNGVDIELFNPALLEQPRFTIRRQLAIQDKFVFGFAGSFSYFHGIEVLAVIIPEICKQNHRAHFLLIGDGPLKKYLMAAVQRAGLGPDQVTFTDMIPQHDVRNYLAACDAYLLPSQQNSDGSPFFCSPTKLFEYMSMSKPVVASDIEQIKEVIPDPSVGILVHPEDHEGFVRACLLLLTMSAVQRSTLGAQARMRVIEHYTWHRHVEDIESFMKHLKQ